MGARQLACYPGQPGKGFQAGLTEGQGFYSCSFPRGPTRHCCVMPSSGVKKVDPPAYPRWGRREAGAHQLFWDHGQCKSGFPGGGRAGEGAWLSRSLPACLQLGEFPGTTVGDAERQACRGGGGEEMYRKVRLEGACRWGIFACVNVLLLPVDMKSCYVTL